MWLMAKIEYLSYSSISSYLTCAEAWKRKYINKEPVKTTAALLFGSAYHSTIEERIKARAERQPVPEITQSWRRHWQAKLEKDGASIDWEGEEPTTHEEDGIRVVSSKDVQKMIDDIKPLIDEQGVYMERKITLTVPGVPVPVIGYIDIMTADGVPGDFKTASRMWSEEKAQDEIQPLFYLAALQQAGHTVPQLAFRHYVVTKANKPRIQVFEKHRTWDEIFWLFKLVKSAWDGIEREVYPLNPGAWSCNEKYCSFWSTCKGKGR